MYYKVYRKGNRRFWWLTKEKPEEDEDYEELTEEETVAEIIKCYKETADEQERWEMVPFSHPVRGLLNDVEDFFEHFHPKLLDIISEFIVRKEQAGITFNIMKDRQGDTKVVIHHDNENIKWYFKKFVELTLEESKLDVYFGRTFEE